MKTKYLILVVSLKKQIMIQKLLTLKKLTDHNHDKYITTPDFNTLAADVFNARLAQANLVTKQIFMLNYQVLIEKLLQINQTTSLLKMS